MAQLQVRDLIDAISAAGPTRPAAPAGERTFTPPPAAKRFSPVILVGAVRAVEFGLALATGLAAHLLYRSDQLQLAWPYLLAIVAISALAVVTFQAVGAYTINSLRNLITTGFKMVGGWSSVFVAMLALVFLLKAGDALSRVWLAGWYLGGLAALLVERICLAFAVRVMARAGWFDRRTAIVGGGEPANEITRLMQSDPSSGIRVVGVFDDRDDLRSPRMTNGFAKLGNVSDLVEYARRQPLDLVIFTLPISAEGRLLQMLSKLWVLPIDIRLSAHASKLRLRPRSYSYIGSVPVLDVFDRPIADWDLVLKSIFDRVVGALLLVLTLPIMAACALAVKLDSAGPALFRQPRHGFNNEIIDVYKFRSMYTDRMDASASKLVTKDDPRVTRVGRILRKTSLDELPQLFNVVFRGDMSLVGPRPHALKPKAANAFYDEVVDGYFARHKVKPGMTGWAQINGWRGETDTEEKLQRRVEHDLYYIENWSVFFDLYILAATPFALLKTENAY